jgi:hypothetical protein
VTFVLIQVAFLKMIWDTHRKVEKGSPFFSMVVIGGALVAGLFAHGMVDHYWSRGGPMMAWAAGGMAVGVWDMTRKKERVQSLLAQVNPVVAWN